VRRMKPPHLQERRTPAWLYEALVRRFGPFELDAFAEPHNALCPRFCTREQDGTRQPWLDQTFANPPFEIMAAALEHAVAETRHEVRSIVLAPVGCTQEWFHELAIRGTVYKPDQRISYDLPSGRPTRGADRDTDIIGLGGEHYNPDWRRGIFRVRRLVLER
jgi:phage N-6-adenine-methyltransferase